MALPAQEPMASRLAEVGFVRAEEDDWEYWEHPAALLPRIDTHDAPEWRMALLVESVAEFLAVHGHDERTRIEGDPLSAVRMACVAAERDAELWVVERHGDRGWEPG